MRTNGQAAQGFESKKDLASNFLIIFFLAGLAALTTACGAAAQGISNTSNPASSQSVGISTPPSQATVGVSYNAVTTVSGGRAPYVFRISDGSLPPGLMLNPRTGSITGTPSVAGTYNFLLSVSSLMGSAAGSDRVRIPGEPGDYAWTRARIVVAGGHSGPSLTISPGSITVLSEGRQQFAASIVGTENTAVIWSASAGSISSNGTFSAPKVTSNTSVTVRATSAADAIYHADASVTVTPQTPLMITTAALPRADAYVPYAASLIATGAVAPYTWSVRAGALPTGMRLDPSSGVIEGTTSLTGTNSFTAQVNDSSGQSATQSFTLIVASSSASGFDGPAELPRIYIQTAVANTPAPGSTITVKAGGDFQAALNSANCGDTIQLQAGATFSGFFRFPAKSCDDNHWIIVRTSADDSALPAEGTRLTPCYAGVTSLPARPVLQCASSANVLARLTAPVGNGPIIFSSGANHYRLTGLEITRPAGTGIIYSLASVAHGGTANNLIFDRVWLHGTAQDETGKGIDLGGTGYVSVVDSFLTDFHCISGTGACTDAHAIGGGGGNPVGPYKIVDNFLEASGENVMFGGAQSATTPADIEISRNHFFKPLIWMPGQPGFVGGANGRAFIAKNLFEVKNAQRVLLEANIMENSWGGFSQNGYAILLTPKNQAGPNGTNLCPNCEVTDVTIRYNTLSHLGAGLQIANALSDNGGAALDGQRYSIHDIIIDDIDSVKYNGSGRVAEMMMGPAPLLQNVSINHITAFAPSGLVAVGGPLGARMRNVTFTNSIVTAGTYPVWTTGGGPANCAYTDKPVVTFTTCFGPSSFMRNAVIGVPAAYAPSVWPTGNFFVSHPALTQFVNFNEGNYQLLSTSPYHNAGTDGKDLGADVSTIASETSGVY